MAGGDDNVTTSLKTSLVNAYHPALNVSNIRSLVPLVLDGETVQFTPWATLFRNTAKVYANLHHIDSTAISGQLSAMGYSISEERLVLQLVGKLTSDYAMVATLIQQASPLPSFSKACSMLELDQVSREKNQEDSSLSSSSTALVATTTSSSGSSGGSVGAGGRSTVMGQFKGSKKHKQCFSKGGNKPAGHQAQPLQPQPFFYPPWVGPWPSFYPSCPFPSAPVQWRGGQGQRPSVSHGQ
ncbi:unnamed protein product [Amaranthus hypochondriacus]